MGNYVTGISPFGLGTTNIDGFFNGSDLTGSPISPYSYLNSPMIPPFPYTGGGTNPLLANQSLWYDYAKQASVNNNSLSLNMAAINNQNFGNQLNINNEASVIRNLIEEGHPNEALEKLDLLAEEIAAQPQYNGISPENARNLAIQQLGGIAPLIESVKEKDADAFKTGFLSALDPGNFFGDHSKSSEEIIAKLQNTEVPKEVQTKKFLGNLAGGATEGAAAGAVIGTFFGPGPGTLIGGAIGGVLGAIYGGIKGAVKSA